MTTTKTLSILFVAIASGLLAGCGGGGSVRAASSGATPPDPPPPPPPPSGTCLPPLTGDCTVNEIYDASGNVVRQYMSGDRTSDYALITDTIAGLELEQGTFRFAGGTRVENGYLSIDASANLDSNTTVQPAGHLVVAGTLTGDATNEGEVFLSGTIAGNVLNQGTLRPDSNVAYTAPGYIDGNFKQAPSGILVATMRPEGGYVSVTGRADIDGTLQLEQATDNSFGALVPPPSAPLSLQVLHADGGVFGQFAQWTSPGLFITGSVRYLANDVYFDATAISVAPTMAAAKAGDAITLQSAARFDAALGNAHGPASVAPGSLTDAQRRFLASAGAIQRLRIWNQAVQTFNSLSGSGYAAAATALVHQASMPAADLMSRMGNLHAGSQPGAWYGHAAMLASGTGTFTENRAGFDGWLADGVLLGASLGWSDGSLQFNRSGGAARDRSPQWDVYLWRDLQAGAYVFGDLGYGRHLVDFNRRIDLGTAQHAASAMRALDVTRGYLEAGRDFRIGQNRLTPFGAVSHVVLHGGGFTEQGGTGFEFIAQPTVYRQTSAAAGLRLGRDWRTGDRWTALNVTAGYRQILAAHDDARAAFTGAPDMTFALDGAQGHRNSGWLQLNLAAGNEHWNWLLSYDRQASDTALSLGAKLSF